MRKKLLLLTLNTFSATGGIEKVCRIAGKALHELAVEGGRELSVYSMYDAGDAVDEAYFPRTIFRGFAGRRLNFIRASISRGRTADIVLLSHINLLPVGYLIKLASPKTKLVLIAHGIEVWGKLPVLKKQLLNAVDLFLPVSAFTGKKLQAQNNIPPQKIKVLNNCLDPFLQRSSQPELENSLRLRYGIGAEEFVLLTLTRLKFSEQYKGYDRVVESLKKIKLSFPAIKYLIVGKYDAEEKARLDHLIAAADLTGTVIFAGFAKDEELNAHFNLADIYIMPSTGEGFGIVFIEALFYGLPVIAGNIDGSVDALAGGAFGRLVNPNDNEEIVSAVRQIAQDKTTFVPDDAAVFKTFGFPQYKRKLTELLSI